MKFKGLSVHQFRAISGQQFKFSDGINVILGPNGAGKTSLLEALYFLMNGKSFRATSSKAMIPRDAESLLLFSEIEGLGSLGVNKPLNQRAQIKLNKAPLTEGIEVLSRKVPMLRMDVDMFNLISGAPEVRRRMIDWGCHQNHSEFLTLWRRYQRAMKQRNQLLSRNGADYLLEPWEKEMAQTGQALHEMRRAYTQTLLEQYHGYLKPLTSLGLMDAVFDSGWQTETSLAQTLKASRAKDRILGYAHQGPHRFDVLLRVEGMPAGQRLSRGQQKLVASALVLSQYQQLKNAQGKESILLMDDLWAEFDVQHAQILLSWLQALSTQIFLTAIEMGPLTDWLGEQAKVHQLVLDNVPRGTLIV